jgi:hypothetical protein
MKYNTIYDLLYGIGYINYIVWDIDTVSNKIYSEIKYSKLLLPLFSQQNIVCHNIRTNLYV